MLENPLKYPLILCSYSNFNILKTRFPKRNVQADSNCESDRFYYWSRAGKYRTVFLASEDEPEMIYIHAYAGKYGTPIFMRIR
jgi:hypothetical protein